MTEDTFDSLDELKDWAKKKFDACAHPDFPDRVHKNWRLIERHYLEDKGRDLTNSTTITEGMDRSATDSASALGLLSITDQPNKKMKTLPEQHKAQVNKFQLSVNKMSRTISQTELGLPGLKRKLCGSQFVRLKQGLQMCRELLETVRDEAEDVKECPDGEAAQEAAIQVLSKLQLRLAEHQDSMQEAIQKHNPAVIKRDTTQANQPEETASAEQISGPLARQFPNKIHHTPTDPKVLTIHLAKGGA